MTIPSHVPGARLAPRKKPLQARSAATVNAILQAAAHILETEGLAACSTNAVAQRAGVSIGSLYQYFPSRDAITRALILEQTLALLREVQAIDIRQGGRPALESLVEIAIAQQLQRPALARVLDVEEQRLPMQADMREYGSQLLLVMHNILSQPDIPPGARSPESMADLLAIIRGMVDAAGSRGERDAPHLRRRVQRAVFGYVDFVQHP